MSDAGPISLEVVEKSEIDRLRALESKVREILSQVGDDPCHLDWGVLYPEMAALAGMPEWKPNILPPMAMARNCLHFIECFSRGKPEEYHPPVITEEEARDLRQRITAWGAMIDDLGTENVALRNRASKLKDRVVTARDHLAAFRESTAFNVLQQALREDAEC